MRVQPQISQYYTTRYLMCTKETGQFKKCLLLWVGLEAISRDLSSRLEEVIGKKGKSSDHSAYTGRISFYVSNSSQSN